MLTTFKSLLNIWQQPYFQGYLVGIADGPADERNNGSPYEAAVHKYYVFEETEILTFI